MKFKRRIILYDSNCDDAMILSITIYLYFLFLRLILFLNVHIR